MHFTAHKLAAMKADLAAEMLRERRARLTHELEERRVALEYIQNNPIDAVFFPGYEEDARLQYYVVADALAAIPSAVGA